MLRLVTPSRSGVAYLESVTVSGRTPFAGGIDEFALWPFAMRDNDVVALRGKSAATLFSTLTETSRSVRSAVTPTPPWWWPHAYYTFDEGGGGRVTDFAAYQWTLSGQMLPLSDTAGAALVSSSLRGTLGGVRPPNAAGSTFINWPSRKASGAPENGRVLLVEDESAVFSLSAVHPDGAGVTIFISQYPSHGTLYQVSPNGVISGAVAQQTSFEAEKEIAQWASEASASSEWGTYLDTANCWCARGMLGPADCSNFKDCASAWCPRTVRASLNGLPYESVYLSYDTPVYVTRIEVYINLGPQAVEGVDVLDARGVWQQLWFLPATSARGSEYLVFQPELCTTTFLTKMLRLRVNTDAVPDQWTEIDAVRMFGTLVPRHSVVLDYDHRLIYIPNPDFSGVDSMFYSASDCPQDVKRRSVQSEVKFVVRNTNDPPVFVTGVSGGGTRGTPVVASPGTPSLVRIQTSDRDGDHVRVIIESLAGMEGTLYAAAASGALNSSSTVLRVGAVVTSIPHTLPASANNSLYVEPVTCGEGVLTFRLDDGNGESNSITGPFTIIITVVCPERATDSTRLAIGLGVGLALGLLAIVAAVALWGAWYKRQMKAASMKWVLRYEELVFEKKIGEGAFGTVFLGAWRGTKVAIKTIRFGGSETPTSNVSTQTNPDKNSRAMAAVSRARTTQRASKSSGTESMKARTGTGASIGSGGTRLNALRSLIGTNGTAIIDKLRANPEKMRRLAAASEFMDEIKIMCDLRHPNVLLFMGASIQYPNIALVTEVCERGDLMTILRSTMEIDYGMKLRFIMDCAAGMMYLHSATPAVLHCDLKCLNLLVDDRWTVKVADFGLAHFSDAVNVDEIAGTIYWMAPELLSQKGEFSIKSDVYSFAMVMAEVISRALPYDAYLDDHPGTNADTLIERVTNGLRPHIPLDVPAEYRELMVDCWNADEGLRPSFVEINSRLLQMHASVSKHVGTETFVRRVRVVKESFDGALSHLMCTLSHDGGIIRIDVAEDLFKQSENSARSSESSLILHLASAQKNTGCGDVDIEFHQISSSNRTLFRSSVEGIAAAAKTHRFSPIEKHVIALALHRPRAPVYIAFETSERCNECLRLLNQLLS
eukprot:Opistho-2@35491